MYRIIEGKVYGVLTDYDLASWTTPSTDGYTKTSQQRTGTPPFMAIGLLDETDTLHLYRHDVESIFYIMLILATHYEIRAPEKGEDAWFQIRQGLKDLPHQTWFDQPFYKVLAACKQAYFSNFEPLNLSPCFEDFRGWLLELRRSFSRGFRARQQRLEEEDMERTCDKGAPVPFDNETLGGHIHYSALIDPVRNLEGRLKGLIIRYDHRSPSTGTIHAGP